MKDKWSFYGDNSGLAILATLYATLILRSSLHLWVHDSGGFIREVSVMAEENLSSKRRTSSCEDRPNVKMSKRSNRSEAAGISKADYVFGGELNQGNVGLGESSEASKCVDWMKLPEEIWSLIFCWIPTKEKVQSRLVSKAWMKKVDSLSSFKVRLDGRMGTKKLEQISEKRIQTVELLSLQDGFEPKFRFPKYVKELIVTTLVSPSNFVKCCEVFTEVQSLRFISTFNSDTTFNSRSKAASQKALGYLKKLKEIDIMIHSFAPRNVWSSETFNVIFNCSSFVFSNLTTINIQMFLHHEEIEAFFKCLLRDDIILKNVTARICCLSNVSTMYDQSVCFSQQPWFSELKKLNFQSLHVLHSQTCGTCDLELAWDEIINNQTSLLRLSADYSDKTISDVFDILRRNKYLRSCKIYRVIWEYLFDTDEVQVLDQVCKSLQELTLEFLNSVIISCNPATGLQSEMKSFFDFTHLPTTLRKLTIRGYNLPRDHFLATLKGLKYIEELNVGNCLSRETSPKISLLKDICHVLGSEDCGVRRFLFDAFEFPSEGDERKQWKTIEEAAQRLDILKQNKDKMNYNERTFYEFRFTKAQIREFAAITDKITAEVGSLPTFGDRIYFAEGDTLF